MIEFINSEMYICNIWNYFSSSNKIPVDPVRVFTDINDKNVVILVVVIQLFRVDFYLVCTKYKSLSH